MNIEKCEIITDAFALRQVSTPVDLNLDYLPKINKLLESFPTQHLGLSAPQIGIFERFFVANLSSGRFVFINPKIDFHYSAKISSTEGCLSVPETQKTILRHECVSINADKILKVIDASLVDASLDKKLYGLDSCIVQHENDHLDGVLIIDHQDAFTQSEMYKQREEKKLQKKIKDRQDRKMQKSRQNAVKISDKRLKDLNKKFKISDKKNKKRVEIQERQKAIQEDSI